MKRAFLRRNLSRNFTYFRACCGECNHFDESQNFCHHLFEYRSPQSSPCNDYD